MAASTSHIKDYSLSKIFLRSLKMTLPYHISDWESAASEKRASLQASIPLSHVLPPALASLAATSALLPSDPRVISCGILTSLDLEITSQDDAALLVAAIACRKYTAVQVVEAFCKRASIAQQCTGCLTEIMYDSALQKARELDECFERTGKTVGILHGLPVSLKVRG
jgi:amidase